MIPFEMVPFVTEQQYNAETLPKGILSMRNMFIAKKPNKSFKPSKLRATKK